MYNVPSLTAHITVWAMPFLQLSTFGISAVPEISEDRVDLTVLKSGRFGVQRLKEWWGRRGRL